MPSRLNTAALDELYARYNRREFARHDPIGFLYRYDEPADREVAGLVAASLAYGRVSQIMRSVASVLDPMGASPAKFLRGSTRRSLGRRFRGFKHRFTAARDLCDLLAGAKAVIEEHGTLEAAFVTGLHEEHESIWPALCAFAEGLRAAAGGGCSHLLAAPSQGSACKRLNLWLRWMVRRDAVDPGGWERVPAAKLVVPLDVHMHRIGLALGLTTRKQPAMRAALEITAGYREVVPDDPVRYDFALTRLGILRESDMDNFLKRCRSREAG